MINFDVTNELMCIARGSGRFYAKKGSMVAFKGDFRFEKLLLGPNNGGGLGGALLGHLQRKITGENMPIMSVEGSGEVYLAEALTYSTTFVGSGVISQRGLFSTYLKNNTNSVQDVAIITDGNPLMIEAPCCVDPDAIVAWTGRKPEAKVAQLSWKTFIGQTSGESYHLQFNEPGQLVIIQPSERLSGLNVSID